MTLRIRDAQKDALRCDQVARDLCALLGKKGYEARYDAHSRRLEATDKAGHTSRYQLAQSGKLEAYITAAGRVSRFQLDDHGQVTELFEPSGRHTRIDYDEAGAPRQFSRNGALLARFAWNQDRTEASAEYWDGTRSGSVYSKAGRPLRFKNRLNHSDSFEYDDSGRLIALVDGAAQRTRFEFDAQGRNCKTRYTDGRIESVLHDAPNGIDVRLGAKLLFEKQVDAAMRPTALAYADGAEYSFAYDDVGRLLSANGPNGSVSYAYGEDGKLQSETSGDQTFRFEYDALGLLSALTYPDGSRAEFGYDPDRRFARARWGAARLDFGYDTLDQHRTLKTPRLYTDFGLDPSGKVAHARVTDRATRQVRFETRYDYDVQNRLVTQADSEFGERHFRYDAQSQLIGVVGKDGHVRESFGYDAAGNRTHGSGHSTLVVPGNRIEAQGDSRYLYDERGNLIECVANGQSCQFEYDLKNQLTLARGPFGVITFKYDALGRRIEKHSPERSIRFVWCGELLTREIITTPQGDTVRDYLYRPGSYEPLAMRVDGRIYYYHNDQLGTPRRLTDEHGEVVWSADYLAFGFAHIRHAQIENPLRLLGQYADVETGLHYNRFRYYSPLLGRYTSVDPASLLGGHNLYVFANNDPINQSDPLGLFSWGAVAAAAGAMVAAAAVVVLAPAAVPIMLAVVGGAALGVALGIGIAEATSIDHFCWPCFMKGAANAFPTAFGIGFGIAAIGAVCPPLGVVLAVGAAAYGTYAVLDEFFGWSSGKPFDDMTDEEKSEALGGLVGGTAGGILGGMAGGAFGKGLAEGLKGPIETPGKGPVENPNENVKMTRGEPPAAGEQPPKEIYRENIGKDLPPEESARIMDERTRELAERDAAETRAAKEGRESIEAERQADDAAYREARESEVAKGKRVGELKKGNASPEEIKQAQQEAQEARNARQAMERDLAEREDARQKAEQALPENHSGKVYEPAYNPQTGDMVVANQGSAPAGESILRPAESLSDQTKPGHCAMPRAASILNEEAAAAGQQRPNIQTTDGGYTIRKGGQVEPIQACKNCEAIRGAPENQIEVVPPKPQQSLPKDPVSMPNQPMPHADDDEDTEELGDL